jgi:D-alanyl-D-alanine carboxypeptidase/D-alanyl-D-alanine-endopeptidase (penicillin-binding protein 4)
VGARGRQLLIAGTLLAILAPALAPPASADTTPPPAPAPPVLAPLDPGSVPAPTPDGVAAEIGRLVRKGLGGGSVLVVDPATGQVLFSRAPDEPLIPASTTKLTTAVAALDILGPQTRIPTIAYLDGGTLYLVGGGDPTLVKSKGGDPLAGGSASLRDLARAVAPRLSESVELVYDTSAFRGSRLGPGWSSSFPAAGVVAPVTALVVDGGRTSAGAKSRVADPAKQAANVFAGLLQREGVTVSGVRRGRHPAASEEIARVESPPVGDIVERMLTESENNFAEALAHLAGGASLGKPTFAGGAAAAQASLVRLGIDVDGLRLVDGSGLSRRDRIPASVLAAILTEVVKGTDGDLSAISPGLAVAGLTGTLADRFTSAETRPGRGFVHAKTGTLTGVVSLAGTVLTADERVLVFAMIANDVRSLAGTRETMDQVASRLATCGCS